MSKKKSQRKSTAPVWPYTPEPSPPLEAPNKGFDLAKKSKMAGEERSKAVPISKGRRERLPTTVRPSLEDVLNNVAPPPYTLAAYTAFLSQQHCLETLEFVTGSRKYSEKYHNALAKLGGKEVTTESDEGFELMMDWTRLLDVYVKPGAPREINLPAEERDDLVEQAYEPKLPPPEALNPSVKRMYDLMSDSIFIPFCNSLRVPTHAQTYNPMSDWAIREDADASRTFDDRVGRHRRSPSNPSISPPQPSLFVPSRSPPSQHQPPQSSSLSSALGRQSGNRLSTHVSNSSARSAPMSEAALTDSSGGDRDSPVPGEQDSVMTPPTTPPASDLGAGNQATSISATSHPLKPQRSESGGWKRMGMKFFGSGKQRRGGLGD
ncbi:hypothetical protein DV737_g4401, partial [Chaetothyriales sp. CBS 132003]